MGHMDPETIEKIQEKVRGSNLEPHHLDVVSEEPTTPLGELAARIMGLAVNKKIIIMLRDTETGEYMTAAHGYEDNREPVVDLLVHLQAMAGASGMRLDFAGYNRDGELQVAPGFEPYEEEG